MPLYGSSDAGIRKMAVYALGALPGDGQLVTLRTALQDAAPDVRWNAAIALARHGNREGVSVLHQMLDREYVEHQVQRVVRPDDDRDPVADVMISGLRAAAVLKDATLRPSIEVPTAQPIGVAAPRLWACRSCTRHPSQSQKTNRFPASTASPWPSTVASTTPSHCGAS